MQNKTLVLIDGSYHMFRAYHGMPDLTNTQGEPTGAIFGMLNMLRKLLNQYKPHYLVAIFDARGKTFRSDLYPEYKAHRPPPPEDLILQIAPTHEIIKALGIPLLSIDKVEADDVIGTLATAAKKYALKTIISSGDKDLLQLVNDDVHMVNPMTQTIFDKHAVEQKYGIPPSAIIDYLALIGDSVDNVPGIPKVGPKTAVKWLTQYHSLEQIVANADNIKGKVGENLSNNLAQLWLSKKLVSLKLDVDLPYQPDQLLKTESDTATLRRNYERWQFKNWLNELNNESNHTINRTDTHIYVKNASPENSKPPLTSTEDQPSTPIQPIDKKDYQLILTPEDLEQWINKLKRSKIFAFDTETTSRDYMQAQLVGISFAITPGEAAYIPLAHDYADAPKQLAFDLVLEKLRPLLEDPTQLKVGHNLKYDQHILANHGINLRGIKHDSMLQSYILNSTASRHNMDDLALYYLQHKTIHYEEVAGKGNKQIPFNQVTIEQALPYAAEDADITLRLHQRLWPNLQKHKQLQHIYSDIEIPLLPVISTIERNGVMIDTDILRQQSEKLKSSIEILEQQAYELAQQTFNINSPQQIQQILYHDMKLPVLTKTPKGQPSTSESVLQQLAQNHELPKLILEHRSLKKLKTTYTDKLPQQINPLTKRVHTSYHQAVTATGRLSSSDPNLQNIPVRTDNGRRIRQAFIAQPGNLLLAADYAQIELCIMAHLSQDQGLLDAFTTGQDVHRRTAAEIFSIPLQAVDPQQRRAAKAINFGLIYGMSAFGLAKQLGISRREANDYIEHYFERYPSIKIYMENTRAQARQLGYVETILGRRLYLAEINSTNGTQRRYAERTAINAPMQGTAADIIKRAMIDIHTWLNETHSDVKLIMQVHDELIFEVPESKAETLSAEITTIMSQAAVLKVPLSVNVGIGKNWDEAH